MGRSHLVALAALLAACSTAERETKSDARTRIDGPGSNELFDAPDDMMGGSTDASVDAVIPLDCGNGVMDNGEACDDHNNASNDGCSAACVLESTQTVTLTAQNLSIPDDGYNGTLGSMACVSVPVTAWYTPAIASTQIVLGLSHSWLGDIVVKAVAPDATTLMMVGRPGYAEPADDGTGGNGSTAMISKDYPITFVDGAATAAEMMGSNGGTVCMSNNICMFAPTAALSGFNAKSSTGTWKLCVGDSAAGDTGKIDRVTFTFGH